MLQSLYWLQHEWSLLFYSYYGTQWSFLQDHHRRFWKHYDWLLNIWLLNKSLQHLIIGTLNYQEWLIPILSIDSQICHPSQVQCRLVDTYYWYQPTTVSIGLLIDSVKWTLSISTFQSIWVVSSHKWVWVYHRLEPYRVNWQHKYQSHSISILNQYYSTSTIVFLSDYNMDSLHHQY